MAVAAAIGALCTVVLELLRLYRDHRLRVTGRRRTRRRDQRKRS